MTTKLIKDWNYNETWLLARCPEKVATFEHLLLTEKNESILEAELEKFLHQAQELEVNATGLHQAFSNMWLSLEV